MPTVPVDVIGKSMPTYGRYSLLQIQKHYIKAGHNMDSTQHTVRNSVFFFLHFATKYLKKERFQIKIFKHSWHLYAVIQNSSLSINRLTPNDPSMGRTASLTSKRFILYIYSTNVGTEYFKYALYSPFFLFKMQFFRNANLFGSCIIHILYTGCAKIKKIIPAPKG